MGKIDDRLNELNIVLPQPATPVANYVGYVITGNLVFISGQITFGTDGDLMYQGIVGDSISIEEAQKAARLCGINILAQLKSACEGDLDRVVRCVKLGGFVNAVPGFENHPMVINGTSDLMVEVFGDKGKHARFAMGAGGLPVNVSVEVDAVFEIS